MAESLPISGYIDPKAFPFLLIDLHRQGATGSLKVEGGHHQKALYFRAGRVLFGSSNDPRDQLGAILIESGRITEQQLQDVNRKVGPGNPLAKALSDSGIVSQRELSEAARAKVERILSDVLSYESGSFEFEDGVLPKGAVDLKLSPERLFLAAVRRVKDRGFVLRHLDGLDVVLSEAPNFMAHLGEIESELAGLAPYLDGQRTLKEAASLAALDEFEAAKIGCGLLFLGLVEKGSTLVIVDSAEASPFFVGAGEGGDLGLLPPLEPLPEPEEEIPSTIPFAPAEEERIDATEILPNVSFSGTANDTLVMGTVPSFDLPEVSPAETPLTLPEMPEPEPVETAPEPLPAASTEPPPLKIIAPPERSRPPAKPTKDDLDALDQLLGKQSPEGPLTPIQKPTADEWKPQFLPKNARGKRGFALDRKLLAWAGAGFALVVAAAVGWMYWSGQLFEPGPEVATTPSASPLPAPPTSEASAPASASPAPAGATESPEPATSPQPSQAGSPPAVGPTEAPATPSPAPKPSPPSPSPTPSTAVRSPSPPSPKPTTAATPAPAPGTRHAAANAGTGSAGQAEARSLLRKGQFPEAARGFEASLKDHRAGYSVQILVACSAQTVEKAVSSVAADDLYILPLHYQGKDCYRLGWGVYSTEAEADAGARGLPAYFHQGGARAKVVKIAEILR